MFDAPSYYVGFSMMVFAEKRVMCVLGGNWEVIGRKLRGICEVFGRLILNCRGRTPRNAGIVNCDFLVSYPYNAKSTSQIPLNFLPITSQYTHHAFCCKNHHRKTYLLVVKSNIIARRLNLPFTSHVCVWYPGVWAV